MKNLKFKDEDLFLDFLKKLDKKLRYISNGLMHFRMNKATTEYIRITKKEYDKMCKIISTGNFIITPVSLGFIGGFGIYSYPRNNFIRDKDVCDLITLFRKDQLPNGMGWNELKPLFNSKKNKELLRFYHFDEIQNESFYDY